MLVKDPQSKKSLHLQASAKVRFLREPLAKTMQTQGSSKRHQCRSFHQVLKSNKLHLPKQRRSRIQGAVAISAWQSIPLQQLPRLKKIKNSVTVRFCTLVSKRENLPRKNKKLRLAMTQLLKTHYRTMNTRTTAMATRCGAIQMVVTACTPRVWPVVVNHHKHKPSHPL